MLFFNSGLIFSHFMMTFLVIFLLFCINTVYCLISLVGMIFYVLIFSLMSNCEFFMLFYLWIYVGAIIVFFPFPIMLLHLKFDCIFNFKVNYTFVILYFLLLNILLCYFIISDFLYLESFYTSNYNKNFYLLFSGCYDQYTTIYNATNIYNIMLKLNTSLLMNFFYWFILSFISGFLFFYLMFFLFINKYKLIFFYIWYYFLNFKSNFFLIVDYCKFMIFRFYLCNKHYYQYFFFSNLVLMLALLPTMLMFMYALSIMFSCKLFNCFILFLIFFLMMVLRFIFFVFIMLNCNLSFCNNYSYNKLRWFYVIIFKMGFFLSFLKNQVKDVFNLFMSKYNVYMFYNLTSMSIDLLYTFIMTKMNVYLKIFKMCVIYMYYVMKESGFKMYIMFIIFFLLPFMELLTILMRLFCSTFYVEASCIDPTDITDMRMLKHAVYGPGPTYDQIRTVQIFSSNERYLLYWYLAAYRIVLFKWNGYTEQELESICLESLDSDVMYGIVDAGKHHYTDYTPDWRPPSNYLEWPVQSHSWMDYGPSLMRQSDYEPATSIIYYGGMFWLFKACIPVFKGLIEVWKSNLRGDEGRGIGDEDKGDYDPDDAGDESDDDTFS